MRRVSPSFAPFLAAALLLLVSSCAQLAAPVANVNFVSVEEERQFSAQFAQEVESKQRVMRDPMVAGYVQDLGDRLAGVLPQPEFRYTFRVVEDDEVNAFNIGGGRIYVHSGLLRQADTEGQLASVLAHEMGHQIHRHVAKAISREQLFQTALAVAGAASGSQLAQLGASLGLTTGQLYFGREAERQADYEMVHLMVGAEYDPNEALRMFEKLQEVGRNQPGVVSSMFSSHPATAERIENVQREIAATPLPSNLFRDSRRFHEVKRRLR